MDLALNNLERLICHNTKQTNQTIYIHKSINYQSFNQEVYIPKWPEFQLRNSHFYIATAYKMLSYVI